ncbi:unnamed protein product [Discosporangium mesarthrocarpum]
MCGSVLQPSRKPSEAKKKWDKTASGDKYRGGYDRNKKPHGQGEMKWALDGSRYKGDFVHGQRHGKVRIRSCQAVPMRYLCLPEVMKKKTWNPPFRRLGVRSLSGGCCSFPCRQTE